MTYEKKKFICFKCQPVSRSGDILYQPDLAADLGNLYLSQRAV
jgi:hypothetical protein